MTIENILASVTISTLISVLGSIITAIISRGSAKKAAKEAADQEIERLQRSWEREDSVSFDSEFSEMIRKAILFALKTSIGQPDTLAAIGAIRAKEHGELALALDELYRAVKTYSHEEADKCIDKIIELKRKSVEQLREGDAKSRRR